MSGMGVHVWEIRSRYVFRIYSTIIALVVHNCG